MFNYEDEERFSYGYKIRGGWDIDTSEEPREKVMVDIFLDVINLKKR